MSKNNACPPRRDFRSDSREYGKLRYCGAAQPINRTKNQGDILRRKTKSVLGARLILRLSRLQSKAENPDILGRRRQKACVDKYSCRKIKNQALLLKHYGLEQYKLLDGYINELEFNDETNREGHAAKVYFNAIFGKSFSRNDDVPVNAALNYGYSLICHALTVK